MMDASARGRYEGGGAARGGAPRRSGRESEPMREQILDLAQAYLDGRLRERGARHLGAAIDAIDSEDGCVLVVRVPKGRTATVDITAYPASTRVLVDSPPIA